MTNGEESSSPVNLLNLPDDLLWNCLARVSRLHYRTLSSVSKRFRSLIASLELYETRTVLGRTEKCLYLCLSLGPGSKPRWFTLCQRPTPTPKPNSSCFFTPCFGLCKRILEEKSSDNVMVSVPVHDFPPCIIAFSCSRLIAIGSNVYMVGAYDNGGALSSRIFFMDCRSHTWHEAPSMGIARKWPIASVVDGKLFVMEGSSDPASSDSSDSIEVFDPRTQMWEHLQAPREEIPHRCSIFKGLAMDGKLYLCWSFKSIMVYEPKENRWDVVEDEETIPLSLGSCYPSCVIGNVMYCLVMFRMLLWYDSEGRRWRVFKGLKGLPKLPKCRSRVKLVDYGGKIAVLWEKRARAIVGSDKKMLWCAVIAVDRRSEQEVYGKVEWCDVVLTVPRSSRLREFLAVNV